MVATEESMALTDWQNKIGNWADNTFNHNAQGIALHLVREAVELALATGLDDVSIRHSVFKELDKAVIESGEREPKLIGEEIADVAILMLTMAHHVGENIEHCIEAKHAVNIVRSWGVPDDQGVTEHVD
jgi:NTP pyrophosphatase (non-canonical NTP hydrolase)